MDLNGIEEREALPVYVLVFTYCPEMGISRKFTKTAGETPAALV